MSIDLDEARGWLEDVFDDLPDDLSDAEVVRAIKRHYKGGLEAFRKDTE